MTQIDTLETQETGLTRWMWIPTLARISYMSGLLACLGGWSSIAVAAYLSGKQASLRQA